MMPVMRPALGEEEALAAADAVRSGWVAQGPRVAEFEHAFAARVGAEHGVAVSSCTTALHLALLIAGVRKDDEVVVPSLSFIATANAAVYVGAKPIFADVDVTGNLTVESIEPALSARTRAVIVVHQAGMPADVAPIRAALEPRGIAVVEDAACAIGSTYHGQPVGAGARIAAWSFHPRKVLTTGEGGMLTLDDDAETQRLRRLREHGMSVSAAERHAAGAVVLEQYLEVGFNYRMTDVQAAIGLVQLTRLDDLVEERRRLSKRYQALLGDLDGVVMAGDPDYGTSNYQSFWVLLPEHFPVSRNALLQRLADNGVSARRGIMAAHLEPAYETVRTVPLPVTERITRDSVILPVFPGMTDAEQDRVIGVVRSAAGAGA